MESVLILFILNIFFGLGSYLKNIISLIRLEPLGNLRHIKFIITWKITKKPAQLREREKDRPVLDTVYFRRWFYRPGNHSHLTFNHKEAFTWSASLMRRVLPLPQHLHPIGPSRCWVTLTKRKKLSWCFAYHVKIFLFCVVFEHGMPILERDSEIVMRKFYIWKFYFIMQLKTWQHEKFHDIIYRAGLRITLPVVLKIWNLHI